MDVGQTWAIIACFLFAAFGFVAVAWWVVGVHLRMVRLEARLETLERERARRLSERL